MNSPRSGLIDSFLATHGWAGATRLPLAGDASFRRYERVFLAGKQAVLMDAPPGREDVRPFIRAGKQLCAWGLRAPRIYAGDEQHGLLLLEDLGNDLFARVLALQPHKEEELYLAATDVLIALYERSAGSNSNSSFPVYDMPRFLQQVALFGEWFLVEIAGEEMARTWMPNYMALWEKLILRLPPHLPGMVLYDFHAENLLWQPDKDGIKRVGLLDFQDAVIGSPAYDMVSFLEDARRDVSAQTVNITFKHYIDCTQFPADNFMEAYAVLGAQRNCRIIGTFVRLARRDGKHHYLSYLPRVWKHLMNDLEHPALAPLKRWMDEVVQPQWRGLLNIEQNKARAAG